MNIYLACGLTHVPRENFDEYTNFIHKLASNLMSKNDNEVHYALINSDPQLSEKPFHDRARLCYLWDKKMVESADLIIAEASYPSTGLGIELQIAENNDIPIIIIFREMQNLKASPVEYENPDHTKHTLQIGDGYVSLMALGLPSIYKVIKYRTDIECYDLLSNSVQNISNEK